jgi:hypothetical protein
METWTLFQIMFCKKKIKNKAIDVTGHGGLLGLWDIENPALYRQPAHRWRWGCQPYGPVVFDSPDFFFLLEGKKTPGPSAAGIRSRTRDLPACSIVTQPLSYSVAPTMKRILGNRAESLKFYGNGNTFPNNVMRRLITNKIFTVTKFCQQRWHIHTHQSQG